MQTKLISGVTPLPNDDHILATINAESDPDTQVGKPMDLAILNAEGTIYRAVRAWGLGEYLCIVQALEGAGLTNTNSTRTAHGIAFDDVFAQTLD